VAVRMVLDYPTRFWERRSWRLLRRCWGRVLLAVGTAAWVLLLTAAVIGTLAVTDKRLATWLESQREWVGEFFAAMTVAAACVLFGIRARGHALMRRELRLVLFLRRFGYADATRAVSYATSRMLGSWRVMTLDDTSLTPIHVTAAIRWPLRFTWIASSLIWGTLSAVYKGLEVLFVLVITSWTVSVYSAFAIPIAVNVLGYDSAPYWAVLNRAFAGRSPVDLLRLDLPGVYAALLVPGFYLVRAVTSDQFMNRYDDFHDWLAAWPEYALATLAATAVAVIVANAAIRNASAASLGRIDGTSTIEIGTPDAISRPIKALRDASARWFGARLTIVKVATAAWRETVTTAATNAAVTLIDVSEPSEHLAWELEQLTLMRVPYIVVGQADRVNRLTPDQLSSAGWWHGRIADLLDGQEILVYESDARGQRRFARALRNRLNSLPPKFLLF
jgi:hypothetical protein